MRDAFIKTLTDLAASDRQIMLLVGDLGFGVVGEFARRFPKQFINAGVAEQNMTALAAGLALSGKVVFTYSIANFPTLRCLEQIRNDICYHHANVKVVAIGGGFGYGALGMTHHATEDLAILRALPEMTVVAPGDPVEATCAVRALARQPGPAYLRLGRAGDPVVHKDDPPFALGRAIVVRNGTDMTLISTGGMLHVAVGVSEALGRQGYDVRVLSMHTVKPLDDEAVIMSARDTGVVVTLEEHGLAGGLGGAVAEVLCEASLEGVVFKRLGLPPVFTRQVGSQEYLRKIHSLDSEGVLKSLQSVLGALAHPIA